ncbi:hypothetical protein GCM10011297_22100 [Bacterioplanes sanyensis]|uniref:DUF6482 family protein n=1 Tax=Bacterioplanes sanyensis TaxID=1249553 RepID=UPI001672564E|nr:DUF6482 family protein [Bacterioplanes sanyensis]GGY48658.1 hypothetical protein GCM10011297_22100 [Bacterioplanes sanyensis]
MSITMNQVRQLSQIDKVVIHSLDLCLYQVSVWVNGEEQYVTDSKGKLLRSFNLLNLQTLFEGLPVTQMVLRQQSAYDEMVGQPSREHSNALEVPLSNNSVGRPLTLQ